MSYIFIERGVRMNREPIILITKPEKQLIEKDNLEIEINNYDNSHLYYKGFDLGTFKEIVNLRQENKQLKDNWNKLREYIKETKLKEFEKSYGKRFGETFTQAEIIVCNMILDKMQELEQGSDSNE